MKKTYLLELLPFSDGLLANCKDQITFDDLNDIHVFIAHYFTELEAYSIFESIGKIRGYTNYRKIYQWEYQL